MDSVAGKDKQATFLYNARHIALPRITAQGFSIINLNHYTWLIALLICVACSAKVIMYMMRFCKFEAE